MRRALCIAGLALWIVWVSSAQAQVIGAHIASVHLPHDGQRTITPGLYVRSERWIAGAYSNSVGRLTVYAGAIVQIGAVDLMLGAATGYARRETWGHSCERAAAYAGWSSDEQIAQRKLGNRCGWWVDDPLRLTPMIALSIAGPQMLGITPRLSYVPAMLGAGQSHVISLSVEAPW